MSHDFPVDSTAPHTGPWLRLLERLTATALLLVLLMLAWLLMVAEWPEWFRLGSEEMEAVVMLALLAAAILLVSAAALVHTWRQS
jgi:hypothetical protein